MLPPIYTENLALSRLMKDSVTNKKKPRIGTLIKVFVTCALLMLIYSKLSLIGLKERLLSFDLSIFLFVAFLYLCGQILSVFKWNLFLKDAGISLNFKQLIKPYFIGMFVNTFGFGTVGGDLTRALLVPTKVGERGKVVSSVIADRVHGLLVLLSIGTIFSAINPPDFFPPYLVYLLAVLILGIAIFWILLPSALAKVIPEQLTILKPLRLVLESFPRSVSTLVKASIISVIFHSFQISMAYTIFKGLGASMTWPLAFTAIPFINIASALPISINGLGVREAISVYMFQPIGINNEISVSFSALWVLAVSMVSGVGGILVSIFTKTPLFLRESEKKDLDQATQIK